MSSFIKWLSVIFLSASSALSLYASKIEPSPKPVDCVINGVKTTAINQAKCDEWVNFKPEKPSITPTVYVVKVYKLIPTIDSDPPVHCQKNINCGGGTTPLRKSECDNSTCCQIGDKWIFYKDKNQCFKDQGQKTISNIPTYTNTYVDNSITCIVSYPCTGNTYTYKLLPNDCNNAQQKAREICSSSFSNTIKPTNIPSPTIDQQLIQAHQQACNGAVQEWVQFKENFMATQYNNYSSSAGAVMALEGYRQKYQQELINAGCSNSISL